MEFKIEALEKVQSESGELSSGDPLRSGSVKTLKSAMSKCEEWIKDPKVYSVWIYKISKEDGCIEQWWMYDDDNKWTHTVHN